MKTFHSKRIAQRVTVPERETELHDKRFLVNLEPIDIEQFVAAHGYDEQMIEDLDGLAVGEAQVYGSDAEPVEVLRIA
jgi:hypothetical protein